jgi:hypothetical protein
VLRLVFISAKERQDCDLFCLPVDLTECLYYTLDFVCWRLTFGCFLHPRYNTDLFCDPMNSVRLKYGFDAAVLLEDVV